VAFRSSWTITLVLSARGGTNLERADEVYRPFLALSLLHQSNTDCFLRDCQIHQDWVVGSRFLDDSGGCQELLELFEDFFTSVIPTELCGLLEQLDHQSRPLGQARDEPGEGGQAP